MPARTLRFANAHVEIHKDSDAASREAAQRIAEIMREAQAARGRAVLGLATGGTPIQTYKHLVALHREGDLSFRDVSTYNLDEYYPIAPTDPNSYRQFMQRHLFDHVDIAPNHTHLLDGTVPEAFAADHCAEYERWIESEGGLDLQLLGIGRNGHIGFNEPSDRTEAAALELPTRLESLHPWTTADAARDFGGDASRVPARALTLGIKTILSARSILLLAFGPGKAAIVARALKGPVTPEVPASLLQRLPAGRVTWLVDAAAAEALA